MTHQKEEASGMTQMTGQRSHNTHTHTHSYTHTRSLLSHSLLVLLFGPQGTVVPERRKKGKEVITLVRDSGLTAALIVNDNARATHEIHVEDDQNDRHYTE